VQAPQRRVEKHERSDADRRRLLLLMLFAASGLVTLVAVIVVIVIIGGGSGSSGTSDAKVAAAMQAAGCTFETVTAPTPPGGQTHIPTLATPVTWNTYPPSNGQHYGLWAVWGFYEEPVNPKQVVHNEEHGAIVIWWGPKTPQSEIEKLRAFYSSSPNSVFGTPIGTIKGESLGSKVALTTWTGEPAKYQKNGYYGFGHVAVCPKFDEKAFKTFRDAYRGHGPEGIPASLNNPGEGPQ